MTDPFSHCPPAPSVCFITVFFSFNSGGAVHLLPLVWTLLQFNGVNWSRNEKNNSKAPRHRGGTCWRRLKSNTWTHLILSDLSKLLPQCHSVTHTHTHTHARTHAHTLIPLSPCCHSANISEGHLERLGGYKEVILKLSPAERSLIAVSLLVW